MNLQKEQVVVITGGGQGIGFGIGEVFADHGSRIAIADLSEEGKAAIPERIPMNRLGQPRDIGEACRFAATTGRYCSGITIRVDGANSALG
ncbi:MAG: hypothetical protein R6V03_08475 [Kiritimatiellia bacterium]